MSVALTELASLREPPPLAPGSHVRLLSPSGPLKGPEQLEQALSTASMMGWHATVGEHALLHFAYFAGDDTSRASDLQSALLDESVDAIWCLRGGYGASRILPLVNDAIEVMAARSKPQSLIGFSDITALHAAWQRAGIVSYHGPTARSPLSDFSHHHFAHMLQGEPHGTIVLQSETATCLKTGVTTGRLAGGNLALLASLVGTPWQVNFRNAIVVLEDIDEASYRVDRMLTQLLLSGSLDGCVGIASGQFTGCIDTSTDQTRPVPAIILELAEKLQVPAVHGFPIGHINDQWTLPLGAIATLNSASCTLSIDRQRTSFATCATPTPTSR